MLPSARYSLAGEGLIGKMVRLMDLESSIRGFRIGHRTESIENETPDVMFTTCPQQCLYRHRDRTLTEIEMLVDESRSDHTCPFARISSACLFPARMATKS